MTTNSSSAMSTGVINTISTAAEPRSLPCRSWCATLEVFGWAAGLDVDREGESGHDGLDRSVDVDGGGLGVSGCGDADVVEQGRGCARDEGPRSLATSRRRSRRPLAARTPSWAAAWATWLACQ